MLCGAVFGWLVLCLCLSHVCCCTYNANDQATLCASFEELAAAENQSQWKILNIVNNGNEILTRVKKGMFEKASEVVNLGLRGIANEMEEGAWNGLNKLYELHLDDNKFQVIRSRAFSNLATVDTIFIYNCEVREIRPKVFDKLSKLKRVFLYNNNISTIEKGVFTGTTIRYINLKKNRIRNLAPNAFGEMQYLEELVVTENELMSFEPQFLLGYTPKLTRLFLTGNKLSKVTRDMFIPLPNLEVLLLNINKIERIGNLAFSDLRNLKTLDVSNNRLEELQKEVFKPSGMKKVRFLFIHNNQLSFLSTATLVRVPNLQWLSVGGNPWQCPCWESLDEYNAHNNITRICYDEYNEGNRPFCVLSQLRPRDCIYDLENARDIPQVYKSSLKDYPPLPLDCKTDGVSNPALADSLRR